MNEDTAGVRRRPEHAIDQAIDRAVRDIMGAEPPAGLRRRVLSRIEAPRPRATLLPRFAFAAVALAAVAVAVVMLRTPTPQAPDASKIATTASPAQAPVAMEPAPPAVLPEPSRLAPASASPRAARRGMTSTPIEMPRIARVFGTQGARVEAAAAAVEDVVFPPVENQPGGEAPMGTPASIAVSEIAIPPLQLPSIRVEPLPARK